MYTTYFVQYYLSMKRNVMQYDLTMVCNAMQYYLAVKCMYCHVQEHIQI